MYWYVLIKVVKCYNYTPIKNLNFIISGMVIIYDNEYHEQCRKNETSDIACNAP